MAAEFNLLEAVRAVFMSDLTSVEKLVGLALLNHWSRTRETFPSAERLAKWTSLGRRTVLRALQKLEAGKAIVVTRSTGRANRYELGSLMTVTSDSLTPVSEDHQCQRITPPVSEDHSTSDRVTPEVIQGRDPAKRSKKSARAGARRRAPKLALAADPKTAEEHTAITKLYFERFESARGFKPVFGPRDGKAVKDLLAQCGLTTAVNAVEGAFRSWWKSQVTIRDIASNPSKFIGLKADEGKGAERSGSSWRADVVAPPATAAENAARGANADAAVKRAEAQRDMRLAKARAEAETERRASEEAKLAHGARNGSTGQL